MTPSDELVTLSAAQVQPTPAHAPPGNVAVMLDQVRAGDPREPPGPESIPTPALSPRQACDDKRSCGSQPAYGSLSDCR